MQPAAQTTSTTGVLSGPGAQESKSDSSSSSLIPIVVGVCGGALVLAVVVGVIVHKRMSRGPARSKVSRGAAGRNLHSVNQSGRVHPPPHSMTVLMEPPMALDTYLDTSA
jgi:hypothetical protein